MRTNKKFSKMPPLWLAIFALTLTALVGISPRTHVAASGGDDDLGTLPFDFADATYRAHGVVP